jgi:GTP-binding protein
MPRLCRIGLVGRPNVGKSSLYNRLLGRRLAVVADQAGTTRDRLESRLSLHGKEAVLFDMAGVEPKLEAGELNEAIQAQVIRSLESADILVWVVDGPAGADAIDETVAHLLRRLGRPVILVVNKADSPKHDLLQYEFSRFGFEPLVTLSAVHGRGIRELTDALSERVGAWYVAHPGTDDNSDTDRELRLALVGRPNVGKSTLLNRLAGDTRSVVSSVAGTTRDAVDTVVPSERIFGPAFTKWKQVRLIDTAGVRRRGKIGHEIEAWSVLRTRDTIDAAEVVVLMLDAMEGMVHQDMQVAQLAVDAGRAFVLVINKWDLVLAAKGTDKDGELQEAFLDSLRRQVPFLHWCQVLFLSAEDGLNVPIIGRVVLDAYNSWNLEIPQSELDELADALRHMPRLKNLQRILLEHSQPPVFHLQVEGKGIPHFSTHRYVENALRESFEIGSTPIKIWSDPTVIRRKG